MFRGGMGMGRGGMTTGRTLIGGEGSGFGGMGGQARSLTGGVPSFGVGVGVLPQRTMGNPIMPA